MQNIRSPELYKVLREVYNGAQTGYISVVNRMSAGTEYATVMVKGGQLYSTSFRGEEGKAAINVLCSLEGIEVSFIEQAVTGERDSDMPHIAALLEGRAGQAGDTHQDGLAAALIERVEDIIGELYGEVGLNKVDELAARFSPAQSPQLFLDMSKELLVPMFGEARADQKFAPLYRSVQ